MDRSASRAAIVTGSGRGMGAACARELAGRGYAVALMSPSGAARELARELGGIGIDGSVTEVGDLGRLVEAAMETFGRIDAVVNNTGHPPKGPLLELSDEQWYRGVELCLLSAVRMARLVTPPMRDAGGGAIVNISAFGAVEPSLDFPVSSTVRAGLSAFTKLYADQEATHNIRMNTVLPGFVDSYDIDADTRDRIPAGRSGRVEEIAGTVAFLVSNDANYITGQSIRVDGGLTHSF